MSSRARNNYLKNKDNPPRTKRLSPDKNTFKDKTYTELLLGGDCPDPVEREFLLWYNNATSPGYPGPDIGCRSTLNPGIRLMTTRRNKVKIKDA